MEVNSFLLSLDVSYWYLEMRFEKNMKYEDFKNRIQLNKLGTPGKSQYLKF